MQVVKRTLREQGTKAHPFVPEPSVVTTTEPPPTGGVCSQAENQSFQIVSPEDGIGSEDTVAPNPISPTHRLLACLGQAPWADMPPFG